MKIAIDISQLAYPNTGVANYLESLVLEIVKEETKDFILFFSSLRRNVPESIQALANRPNVTIRKFKLPPIVLHHLWNTVHKVSIEKFVGSVDLFISSDWTEPPTIAAKKATILYDLIVYKYPKETHRKIVEVQKKKLSWVKKESDIIFCISESTKKDAAEILHIDPEKIRVIYPGF